MANYVTPTIGTGAVSDGTPRTELLINEVWAKEIADNRVNNLVLWQLIDHRYQGDISQSGDVLHIDFVAEITDDTSTNASVTVASTVDALNVSQTDLLIDRYLRKAVGIQDVAAAQSLYEMRAPYLQRLGRFLDRGKDEEVWRKAVTGFTKTISVTGGSGSTVAFADIVNAAAYLDAQNVPTDDRFIVVNGYGLGDLRKVAEFTLYNNVGESGIVKGTKGIVGEIYGMPVYVTNAVAADNGNYQYLMFHRSAIIGATQITPKVESDRDKLLGQDYVVGSELFGVKVLRADHGVRILRPVTS